MPDSADRAGAVSRPLTPPGKTQRSLGPPLFDDPGYEDPFASRARLRSRPARGPIRRRIWDLEDESDPDAETDGFAEDERPQPAAMDPSELRDDVDDAPPEPDAGHEVDAAPDAPPEADELPDTAEDGAPPDRTVAEARAQVARMAEQGLAASDLMAPAGGAQEAPGRSARAKTRVLGFQSRDMAPGDPFARGPAAPAPMSGPTFPVGWLVVVDGPGRGASFTLQDGVSSIGRGEDQVVRLDFGDTSISRQMHASVAFDDEMERFYLGHGGKSNLVRLNDRPVLSTEELTDGAHIRIGETTLRFVALCGEDFSWASAAETGAADVAAQ
ncbi:MAG: FHA domain-containing protein [Pseudomonadota bacterium]